ncbi:unnamed protein product [Didymodactylos carnosus]|uniref:Uncharacterized protein n=1 Tax=Didymodactylos carnosus TaxID=1234261 RepID=A0A814BT84_9BILA|nr:unnamed protein product [Didymodactylos carnosus]CAF0950702.1 unnamed protein product [Didymodactylos carnosus]CAF3710177.1 unnamed protein product [Didymodactylos carnosus]CAF3724911.1 unnamed protein product [Didymodactylos carnosus]
MDFRQLSELQGLKTIVAKVPEIRQLGVAVLLLLMYYITAETEEEIKRKLTLKAFVLLKNKQDNHEIWANDASIVEAADSKGDTSLFEGWIARNP